MHKFVLDTCFDTLFVASSAFSETRAFRNNWADIAKAHERNFCATRAQCSTTWAQIPATERNFKRCTYSSFCARALFNHPSGIFSVHKFVYQWVLQVVIVTKLHEPSSINPDITKFHEPQSRV